MRLRGEGGGSAPDSAGGAYSAPPDPLAGNGGGPRGGKGKRRGLRRGREGRGRAIPRTKILATALVTVANTVSFPR